MTPARVPVRRTFGALVTLAAGLAAGAVGWVLVTALL